MLTLIAVKAGMKKLLSFVRRYAYIIVVALILVVVALGFKSSVGRRLVSQLWDIITRERRLHEEYTVEVDAIHDEQVAAVELAAKHALAATAAAEAEYVRRNEVLDSKKKREIERIVKANIDDPTTISRKLAEQFGFDYTLDMSSHPRHQPRGGVS